MVFPTNVGREYNSTRVEGEPEDGRAKRPGTGAVNPRDTQLGRNRKYQGREVRTDLKIAGSGDGRPCVLTESFWKRQSSDASYYSGRWSRKSFKSRW